MHTDAVILCGLKYRIKRNKEAFQAVVEIKHEKPLVAAQFSNYHPKVHGYQTTKIEQTIDDKKLERT
jgi:hypothetical protein